MNNSRTAKELGLNQTKDIVVYGNGEYETPTLRLYNIVILKEHVLYEHLEQHKNGICIINSGYVDETYIYVPELINAINNAD